MKGQSDSKFTNKTEFMRYLDDHFSEFKALSPRVSEYRKNYPRGTTFGFWLREKYGPCFIRIYKGYWLKHPELYYTNQQNVLSV